ncbi:cytochrome P450 704C1-like protein [Tanacetum coccineum]|uniref:Cytochrome P450 704C1-like protein n=1 Tax=Tanacetum coccineum TaxID=301880 RepID=A0ABQ5G226_9ASTR
MWITSMDILSNLQPILVITTISIVLVCYYVYNQQQHKKKKHHPIASTMLHHILNFHRLHDYMTELATKYKTYRVLSPFGYEVYTSDPANVEYMLKTNFENYGKGTYTHEILRDLLGDGIFTVDGDKWREQRKVSSYEFSTKVLRDFSSVIFRKNAVKLATMLSEAANNNQSTDINDLFMKATLDSIFKVAFGIDLDSMCGSNEEGVRFSNAFDDASALTLKRYVDIAWKIKKYFNIGSEAKLKESVRVVDEFVYKLIQTKTERTRKGQDDSSYSLTLDVKQTRVNYLNGPVLCRMKKEDILSRFLQIEDKDPKYIRDIILSFIIAGKDTTSTAMTWFIYMICKHPDIQEKVAKEIKEATNMRNVTNGADFANSVSEEALEKMQYLHAALTETLRLFPAVPVDAKICFEDDVLPDGYNVNKGDMVSYQPYAMGRMKFIWGDDAEDFKPERWLDDNGCFQSQSSFKFTAFQVAHLGRTKSLFGSGIRVQADEDICFHFVGLLHFQAE